MTTTTNDSKEHILCPVRGGKGSARTIDKAIELALEKKAKLSFLYIVDVDFLGHATVARVNLMVEELIETGSFALSILCEKAKQKGVAQVDSITRRGQIRDVIKEVLEETGATFLVTGRPAKMPGEVNIPTGGFGTFLKDLEDSLNINIVRVD